MNQNDVPAAAAVDVTGVTVPGKSTLLHCLAGLDTVDSGTVHLGGTDLGRLSDRDLTRLRRDRTAGSCDAGQCGVT